MGYRRPRKEYQLNFTDPELAQPGDGDALQVTIKGLSVDDYLTLIEHMSANVTDVKASRDLMKMTADSLIGWNLETEEGQPVALTLEGLGSQDRDLLSQILFAWVRAMSSVAPPLEQPANGTGTLPEHSLPMEVSSAPLPN